MRKQSESSASFFSSRYLHNASCTRFTMYDISLVCKVCTAVSRKGRHICWSWCSKTFLPVVPLHIPVWLFIWNSNSNAVENLFRQSSWTWDSITRNPRVIPSYICNYINETSMQLNYARIELYLRRLGMNRYKL